MQPSPARVTIVSGDVTRELRRRVLRPYQAVSDPLPGDGIADAVHFAILDDDGRTPLAACFLLREDYPWPQTADSPPSSGDLWHLRAVATEPARQRTGLGQVLMSRVADYVAGQGGGVLWCNARTPAVPFYERLGMVTYGDEHISHGLAHFYMWRVIEPRRAAAGEARLDQASA